MGPPCGDGSSDAHGIALNGGINVGTGSGREIKHKIASGMRHVVDYDQD